LEPSSSKAPAAPHDPWRLWDHIAIAGLGVGLALYVLPLGAGTLRVGFFLTLAFTILHIVTSHCRKPGGP
jgi:hypothetical protein